MKHKYVKIEYTNRHFWGAGPVRVRVMMQKKLAFLSDDVRWVSRDYLF